MNPIIDLQTFLNESINDKETYRFTVNSCGISDPNTLERMRSYSKKEASIEEQKMKSSHRSYMVESGWMDISHSEYNQLQNLKSIYDEYLKKWRK